MFCCQCSTVNVLLSMFYFQCSAFNVLLMCWTFMFRYMLYLYVSILSMLDFYVSILSMLYLYVSVLSMLYFYVSVLFMYGQCNCGLEFSDSSAPFLFFRTRRLPPRSRGIVGGFSLLRTHLSTLWTSSTCFTLTTPVMRLCIYNCFYKWIATKNRMIGCNDWL